MAIDPSEKEFFFSRISQPVYDGASTHYRIGQNGLLNGPPDKLAAAELNNLRARSHHAVRNNGWGMAAFKQYKVNLGAVSVLWKNEKGKTNKKMQKWWDEFAEHPCIDNYGDLCNMQDVWNAGMFTSGEIFTRMRIKARKDITVPLVLELIEAEYLDPNYNDQNKNIRNGIQFDGPTPVKYWFNKNLPSAITLPSSERVGIDAEDVIHLFKRLRAGQWRGVPELAPILLALYELDELTDATVNKQKAAQAISWIITNTNPSSAFAIGTVEDADTFDEDGQPAVRKISQTGSSTVQYLNKGEQATFHEGNGIGDNFDELIKLELGKIAMSSDLHPTILTGDLGQISFSALKYVISEMRKKAEAIHHLYIINLGLKPLCARFKELAMLRGSRTMEAVTPYFQLPKLIDIDGLSTAQQDHLEVEAGLNTLENVLAAKNLTMEQVSEDIKKRESLGIELTPTTSESNPTGQIKNNKPNTNTTGA